ncbi:MAG TPA: GNAT family N-acetyltransferase [Novosphingobium sp.]|nr:GNAT family N-acetyltransferase [Novosphingobium sp.]
MFIRSERLFLRPGWPEDWQELTPLIADEKVVRNLAGVPWPYTGEDARRFLSLPQEHRLPRFLVTLPDAAGARIIGGIGLDRRGQEIQLGCWIARDHRGRGYAGEAARAVIEVARTLGHGRIVASHFLDNPASGRVLERVGFRRTGRIVERPSTRRGTVFPAREYVLDLGAPADHHDDMDRMRSRETEKYAA